MAFSFINSSSVTGGTGSGVASVSVPKPTNTADNDFIYVVAAVHGSGETVTFTGFTLLDAVAGNQNANHNIKTYFKIASGEPASWTMSFSPSTWVTVVAYTLRGSATASPVPNHSTKHDAASYVTAMPQAVATIQNATDATVYAYAGGDNTDSGAITITGTPGTLSNFAQATNSSQGAVVGIGWGVNVASPGNATSGTAVDYMDAFADVLVAPVALDDGEGLTYSPCLYW